MGIEVVRVAEWAQYGWLRHGFSIRAGGASEVYGPGELNLGFTREDERTIVEANRAQLLAAIGVGDRLATVSQVHSARVEAVRGGEVATEADGMVTAEAGLALGILTADCVPVLVVDVRRQVVGAFHAGWRGTAAGIVGNGVQRMQEEFGCAAEDLIAAVGPSIGPCCYEIGDEVRAAFAADLFVGNRFDLWSANRQQLQAAGVARVSVVGECTACARVGARRKYFSYRAEGGVTGRMMAVIGVEAP